MPQPPPDPSARNALLLAFPVRLYTALRTVRLDPAATPRTLHSIDLLEQTFRSLLAAVGEDRVELAVVEQHLLVCSEQLSDRDQARPQIQGLITLFLHLQVHSLTLHTTLTRADFTRFALLLAGLPEGRVPPEPLPVLVDRAGLHSIVVASRRCAAPGEDEPVVRTVPAATRTAELADDPAGRLLAAAAQARSDEELAAVTTALLTRLAGSTELDRQPGDQQVLARALTGLEPGLLARLLCHLPQTPPAGQLLDAVLEALPPEQLDQLAASLRDLLKRIPVPPLLDQLLTTAVQPGAHRDEAARILTALGTPAARLLLQHLMSDDHRFARRQLLDLLGRAGEPATASLLEQLHRDAPWYVLRTIIRLLGEVGGPEHFAVVRPFLAHPDLRVQQEVLTTARRIGGTQTGDFLLEALQSVPDALTTTVVQHAAEVHDERFVRPLTDLLERPRRFLGKNGDDLQLAICRTLGAIGSTQATATLGRVAASRTVPGLEGTTEAVRQAAARALAQIRRTGEVKSGEGVTEERTGAGSAPSGTEEEAIFALVTAGQVESAKKRLLDLIAATARAGDFRTAERLRDRIYEIDGLALTEIIRAGEIIEAEKRGAIRGEDLEIWAALTDTLSSEEFQTIYHEFIERSYKPEETIVGQGASNEELFFINRGSVKVSHLAGSRELFITSLHRGQIAGENFFTPSLWTVSLTSLTPVTLYVLPRSALSAWQERFPGLRTRLHQFYAASNNIHAMLDRKGLERRRDQRFTLTRRIQVQPVNTLDVPTGRGFRAETADLSLGGLAFLIRIGRQENARLLLGRRMQVVLPVGGAVESLVLKGLIIGVQPFHLLQNDFSVHFRFDRPLDEQELQTILG